MKNRSDVVKTRVVLVRGWGKSNGFKSSGYRMSDFGVKGVFFLNSVTSWGGQCRLFSTICTL